MSLFLAIIGILVSCVLFGPILTGVMLTLGIAVCLVR